MWRTWIKIEMGNHSPFKSFQDTIRVKVSPFLQLKNNGHINWFYFLFHPKPDDSTNYYFDVVFTTDEDNANSFLPEYCIGTEKINPTSSILGIDVGILEDTDIREAWKIIGEQSEFIIDLVLSHKKDLEIHPKQIAQFMHYFMNPLGYGMKSVFLPRGTLITF
jgi:hypothetical protein